MAVLFPISAGYQVTLDEDCLPLVEGYRWTALVSERHVYAYRKMQKNGIARVIMMHRLIAGASEGQDVDHIDHDGLNNRQSNLRLATRSQNLGNCRLSRRNKTGFKGVTRAGAKYRAQICVRRDNSDLGMFATAEEAARAYDAAARLLFGSFAYFNFPAEIEAPCHAHPPPIHLVALFPRLVRRGARPAPRAVG